EEAGEDAVAGRGECPEDDVARLFTAKGVPTGVEGFEDVPVSDRRFMHGDPSGRHPVAESEIGHDGDDDGVVWKPTLLVEVDRGDGEDLITVDELTRVVDSQDPVGVTVECEAEIGTGGRDGV